MLDLRALTALFTLGFALAACGDDDSAGTVANDGGAAGATGAAGRTNAAGAAGAAGGGSGSAGAAGASSMAGAAGAANAAGDAQRPPTDAAAMVTWLAAKYYEAWACEPEPTEKKDGSPGIHAHATKNRVCSNALMAETDRAAGGEWPAGVAAVKEIYGSDGSIVNYAVALKTGEASDGGRGWYWFEGTSPSAIAGFGAGICTGCHGAASSDSGHPGAGDYVYFRVAAP